MLYITLVKYRQRVVSSLVIPSLSSLPHFAEVYVEREMANHGSARFPLCYGWEREPLLTPGLRLLLARAQRGRGGLEGEGRKRAEIHE